MNLRSKRKLAARILGIGEHKIYMSPEWIEDISESLTREDMRKLIKDNIVQIHRRGRNSRGRANLLRFKKMRGQRRGPGSRKGKKTARAPPKDLWIQRIRAQRRYLRMLRTEGYIDKTTYRILYRQAKGGEFRSKAYLKGYISEKELSIKRLPELY